MTKDVSRRNFLKQLTAVTATSARVGRANGAAPPDAPARALPHRVLGRTGASISILAFGCGSRFLMFEDEDRALAVLNRALDLGINYLDTAYAYGDGKSETRVGKVMATRRKEVFLATKCPDRTRDDFLRRLEGCLKRLQVAQVDLVHIHSLGDEADLQKLEAPEGALRGLMEARQQKMTRFAGMTSHTHGDVMARAIERHDLDCVQIALNATRNGRFEELALAAARKKNLGVIAMKVCGQEFLVGEGEGKADFGPLFRYSLSLPVATAVVGMPKVEFLEHNIELARNFSPLGDAERSELQRRLEPLRAPLENRLVGHLDGPDDTPQGFNA